MVEATAPSPPLRHHQWGRIPPTRRLAGGARIGRSVPIGHERRFVWVAGAMVRNRPSGRISRDVQASRVPSDPRAPYRLPPCRQGASLSPRGRGRLARSTGGRCHPCGPDRATGPPEQPGPGGMSRQPGVRRREWSSRTATWEARWYDSAGKRHTANFDGTLKLAKKCGKNVFLVSSDQTIAPVRRSLCCEEVERALTLLR
jgi:hypothetical protein